MSLFLKNKISNLFSIKYPIIQGGMVWCSGWKLATAVSNNGGLGLIGAGSMSPELLEEHISKAKKNTNKPFGVNLPLMKRDAEKYIEIILKNKVEIVFTSAGNPKSYTKILKSNGCIVAHVVSSKKFALKTMEAGVDAIVAEGFEAGGHNGREETTTMTLLPSVAETINIPLIAAGGISNGKSMLSAMILGADGVQIGSRFAISRESSAHEKFKELVIKINEGDTRLALKQLAPVRLIKNKFFWKVDELESNGASVEELSRLLGFGRTRKGIFEGKLEDGELEIGQVSSMLNKVESCEEIINNIIEDYKLAINAVNEF